ncbi:MAG TPA: glycerate kinase [Anaeromyxobacteraceae bacterium]|nr:glycerate kinase [Anaeromyxobacteraceae bacterium]
MRVVVAPDSFKGSCSALSVAEAMGRGIRAVFPDAEVRMVPIADGGEGTVEALVAATKGRIVRRSVRGPLGEPVTAHWGVLGDGATAVIEMAAASGLPLVPKERRDPRVTTTYGTGELMLAALESGASTLIVGIGGSATNDGGTGMARALGVRFLDSSGNPIPEGGAALARLARIDRSGMDRRAAASSILVACDVDNPLTGPRGASAVYGPQKGATPEMVQELDAALGHYAEVARAATGRDIATLPGAGAAGGLGAGLLFFTPARLRPGVEVVLEATRFDDIVKGADLVVTGEGRTDFQTAMGKAPVGVAAAAKRHGIPVICVSGGLSEGADEVLAKGIDALASVAPGPMTLEEAMRRVGELVESGTARAFRLIRAGLSLGR